MSEGVAEIMCIKQVLEFLHVEVGYPIIVNVDNVGAMGLANNQSSSQRTRHVDIRYHFVREFIEDGIVKIIFVRSEDNERDIFTKNVNPLLVE